MDDAPAPAENVPDIGENVPDTFWVSRVVVPEPVRAVSAANGLVVAAGASLHQLRPGSKRVRTSALPAGHGDVVAILAEPWSPFRLAVAWSTNVGVFTGHQPHDPVVSVSIEHRKNGATHLAWMRLRGENMLYVRQKSGEVQQVNLDTGAMGTLQLSKAYAVASDAKGVLGALVKSEENDGLMNLQVLPPGEMAWDVYGLDYSEHDEDDPEQGRLHLAVHGPAVAISGETSFVSLSWEPGEEEGWRDFALIPAVFMGPVTFRSDKEIFAAYNVEGQVNLRRHVRGQGVTRIARYGLDDKWEGTEATVTSIAWDQERHTLWAASPELGLMALTQPD